ncbi:MAG TPA: hypothetical protein DCL49_04795, partial [Candidatus Omnitrophica bacterium]|nr:hypothetical protein [Candidatus Omnitrophota bacterium]
KNEKYIGTWNWRKSKVVRNPMTGKKKKFARPEKDIIPIYREDLIIINKELWEKAQKRWHELKGTWPVTRKNEAFISKKVMSIQALTICFPD